MDERDMINDDELQHHGIQGQRWGVRRFQRKDGSLTPKGEKRREKLNGKKKPKSGGNKPKAKVVSKKKPKKDDKNVKTDTKPKKKIEDMTDDEIRKANARRELEKRYKEYDKTDLQNQLDVHNLQQQVAALDPKVARKQKWKKIGDKAFDAAIDATISAGKKLLETFLVNAGLQKIDDILGGKKKGDPWKKDGGEDNKKDPKITPITIYNYITGDGKSSGGSGGSSGSGMNIEIDTGSSSTGGSSKSGSASGSGSAAGAIAAGGGGGGGYGGYGGYGGFAAAGAASKSGSASYSSSSGGSSSSGTKLKISTGSDSGSGSSAASKPFKEVSKSSSRTKTGWEDTGWRGYTVSFGKVSETSTTNYVERFFK